MELKMTCRQVPPTNKKWLKSTILESTWSNEESATNLRTPINDTNNLRDGESSKREDEGEYSERWKQFQKRK